MKRRISLSIALVMSIVLLSLMNFDLKAQEQTQGADADTGIIGPLPSDQVLRITATNSSRQTVTVRFKQIEYMPDSCNGAVCKLVPVSQMTYNPITLAPNEGASITLSSVLAVRGIVQNGGQGARNAHVTAQIIK